MRSFVLKTPFGNLEFLTLKQSVIKVNLNSSLRPTRAETELEKMIQQQLEQYIAGTRTEFSIPHNAEMTAFQAKICLELKRIPIGETITYGELAKRLLSSPRAIGGGCRRNPLPVLIPCHRVTAAKSIGGFAGETEGGLIDTKQWLLNHEKALVSHGHC